MTNEEFLNTFTEWVEGLVDDAKVLYELYKVEGLARETRKKVIGALAYLLRKVDIVPDYLGGLGSVDDAMVLRLAAAQVLSDGLDGVGEELQEKVKGLAGQADVIREFLGAEVAEGLDRYVAGLSEAKVRGRTPDQILDDANAAEQFVYELEDEFRAYKPREFKSEEKSLLELRSYIAAKIDKQ